MKKIIIALICVLMALVTGCGHNDKIRSDEKVIVTSFYPMYVAAINIADGVEGVKVVNMTKPQTGCLHDYQLSAQDMALLEKCDIFIANGGGMEDFLEKVIKQQPKMKVIEASKGIELIKGPEGDNPHVWVSVANDIQQAKNIAKELAEIDPEHQQQYQKNCEDYVARLEKLRQEMHKDLDAFAGSPIVTFHEAFPYFAREFNLKIAAVIDREPGTEPTPKELEETIGIVKATGVKAIFTEPQYSPGAATTISNATGIKVYQLDPVVTGEATPEAKNAYIDVMKKNSAILREALSK